MTTTTELLLQFYQGYHCFVFFGDDQTKNEPEPCGRFRQKFLGGHWNFLAFFNAGNFHGIWYQTQLLDDIKSVAIFTNSPVRKFLPRMISTMASLNSWSCTLFFTIWSWFHTNVGYLFGPQSFECSHEHLDGQKRRVGATTRCGSGFPNINFFAIGW